MKRLSIPYVPFQQSIEPLYRVIDNDGVIYCEPMPYKDALERKREVQARLDAEALEDYATACMLMG